MLAFRNSYSAYFSGGGRRLGQYEQHDLVQLVDCVGVIVECGADTARVLTSGGRPDRPDIRTVRLPDIKKRAGSRNAVTNDLSLQPVRPPAAPPRSCTLPRHILLHFDPFSLRRRYHHRPLPATSSPALYSAVLLGLA